MTLRTEYWCEGHAHNTAERRRRVRARWAQVLFNRYKGVLMVCGICRRHSLRGGFATEDHFVPIGTSSTKNS